MARGQQHENGAPPPLTNGVAKKPTAIGSNAATRPPTTAAETASNTGATKATTSPAAGRPTQNGGGEDGEGGNKSLRRVCLDVQRKVAAFLAEEPESALLRSVQQQVRVSLSVIDKALEQYRLSQLSISYNGGKDCLVLLILILASLPRHFDAATPSPAEADGSRAESDPATATTITTAGAATPPSPSLPAAEAAVVEGAPPPPTEEQPRPFPTSLQALYVVSKHPFAEVDGFVDQTSAAYHLSVERIALAMRPALHAYLTARPSVRAVFVGTRRTDPHGERLTHFDPTDPGWPPFMRVHPVIDWHYVEIWAFIRHLGIPYCELYDRGYTSLGGTTDTSPNPALKRTVDAADGTHEVFRPAYELMDDYEERLGRDG